MNKRMKNIQNQVQKTLQGGRQKKSTQKKPKKSAISKFFKKNYITIYISLTLLLIIVCIFYIYKLNQDSRNIETPDNPRVLPTTDTPPPKPPVPDPPTPPPITEKLTNIYLIICVSFMGACFFIVLLSGISAMNKAKKKREETEYNKNVSFTYLPLNFNDRKLNRSKQQKDNTSSNKYIGVNMSGLNIAGNKDEKSGNLSLLHSSQLHSSLLQNDDKGEYLKMARERKMSNHYLIPVICYLIIVANIVLSFLNNVLDPTKQTSEGLVVTFRVLSFVFLFLYYLLTSSKINMNFCIRTPVEENRNCTMGEI